MHFDFCNRQFVNRVFTKIDEFSIILGHTRSATRGTSTARNAHPFQHNHITLTHNGTVGNAYDIVPIGVRPQDVNVDSDIVCYAMGTLKEKEDEEQILEKLKGPFALVWHNARDASVNIARNEQKPIFLAYLKDENTMLYASEYTTLAHLLERRGMKIEDEIIEPSPLNWFKFHIADLRKYTKRPFVVRHRTRPPSTDTGTTDGMRRMNFGRQDTDDYPDPTPGQMSELRSSVLVNSFDVDKIETIATWLKEFRSSLPPGAPKSAKKVQQAAKALREVGYKFCQICIVDPDTWVSYRKNKGNLGQMVGKTRDGLPFVMHNVTNAKWQAYYEFGKVYARVLNVKKINSKQTLVVVEHPIHATRSAEFFRAEKDGTKHDSNQRSFPSEALSASPSLRIERTHQGPSGRMVTRERFFELTCRGCGYCSADIMEQDHLKLYWTNSDTPICLDCQGDSKFWTSIGQSKPPEIVVVH